MTLVTIAAAQVASVSGDIEHNVVAHIRAAQVAARLGVSLLVFPELSLTGYEPTRASELALAPDDDRLQPLRALAMQYAMTLVLGAPLVREAGPPQLGALVCEPDGTTHRYAKMSLGAGERGFFAAGEAPRLVCVGDETVGLAICADASVPSHPQAYAAAGASVYAAGVFLNAEWYETDVVRFPAHAARFGMLVLMANHAASMGTYESVGKSAVWGPDGTLLAQADGAEACLVTATSTAARWRGAVVPI